MRTRFWTAACAPLLVGLLIGLSGCGDKTKTEDDGGDGGGGGGGAAKKDFVLALVAYPRILDSPLLSELKANPELTKMQQQMGINLEDVEHVTILLGPDFEEGI